MATTLSATKESSITGYDHNDPSLRTGDGGLTVWVLQKMAQEKRFNELDNLFDNGLTMNALPVGVCAGTPARVFNIVDPISDWLDWFAGRDWHGKIYFSISDWLDWFAGQNWRGKIYFSSNNKRVSEGRNRVREFLADPRSPFIPMCKFQTVLVDNHPLAPRAKSNIVVLKYADPRTKPYLLEQLVEKFPVIDLMVAVKGKYGPVFVGKTWLGRYDEKGEFAASNPDKLNNWYFLDFNEGALREQRESHWDGSREEMLDPIPHVNN